ncbi:hemerythrin domain-containing protein [Ramlibacter sp.]|uniref:hemerythrin domain-containing protein n=1 Tax=Ramlibacter sp. TaxID=1917967 RepID=UPI00179B0B5E|nr:hemerythrin domain-containing protein [Ramlibacter sp.]MBA2676265.1 hemerythrin domain-containing protein [Ramlibacter sp.]
MTSLLNQISPSATNQIRLDHMHVLATFHQYEPASSTRLKRGLADSVCLALEIHAQLEEEIFYPALALAMDSDMVRKSPVEHGEMRTLMARLRQMVASDPVFDETFFELMRLVLHHVADEETVLLPAAERLIPGQLQDLGARMARRRLQLAASRGGELASSLVRSFSARGVVAAATTVLSGSYLLARHSPLAPAWMRRGGPRAAR